MKFQPTPVLLPGKFRGQRSLVGYSPWGRKESDMTERLHFTSLQTQKDFHGGPDSKESACDVRDLGSMPELGRFPGEGNGSPLQYSCLENPMDRGVWWATVVGSQSWTWLSNFQFFWPEVLNIPKLASAPQEGGRMFQRRIGWPELVYLGESRVGEGDNASSQVY